MPVCNSPSDVELLGSISHRTDCPGVLRKEEEEIGDIVVTWGVLYGQEHNTWIKAQLN